jgi:V-type H+-transporting ATPase subunit a
MSFTLAHSQLSLVLYEELLMLITTIGKSVIAFVGFAGWAGENVPILLGMKWFSFFLYEIRLMQTELSSQFDREIIYEFSPLSLK